MKPTPKKLQSLAHIIKHKDVVFDSTLNEKLKDGEPCDHSCCAMHVTHPCEQCGRIGARKNKINPIIIAVDFDGTCVTHEYPKVGRFIGAEGVLRDIAKYGHKIILFTMRHDQGLKDAVEWFEQRNIPLYGINMNPDQFSWTNSPKAYANLYIDDAALGAPLCSGLKGERPHIDWEKVRKDLIKMGILPK